MVVNWILEKISGNYNDKQLRKLQPLVDQINEIYESWHELSDADIQAKTDEFKQRVADGASLDSLLPEAYATVKQACKRLIGTTYEVKWVQETWNMIPYDVQLIGGIALHQRTIAEMRTGEGKTLVATLPVYLNALTGKGVHVVTVNDYLASRDAEAMGLLYEWLWLSVASVTKGVQPQERRERYGADVVYVENAELGFDYLRDNLAGSMRERALLWRPLHFALIDEVDSILIDEARTPLIISQPSAEPTEKYLYYAKLVPSLTPSQQKKKVSKWFLHELMQKGEEEEEDDGGDYYIDEKIKTVTLSSSGIAKLEKMLGVENLYKDLWYQEIHHIENALKANAVYERDKDYLVKDGQVMIVDQNTGRVMPGRRFSQGLHQALEAKEQLQIQRESRTLATITYQHFFKQYEKLSGMTGTAATEAEEFEKIYELETLIIPTNKPIIRVDHNDRVYYNQDAKWKAVMDHIAFYHQAGVPILIGTSSIHTSELVSKLLHKQSFTHYVLNAKFHEQEANIVMNAGKKSSIVVATNMAGRGTDIKLEKGLRLEIARAYLTYMQRKAQRGLWFSGVLFSTVEYELFIDELQAAWGWTEDEITAATRGWQVKDDLQLRIIFNSSKKTKEDPLVEIRCFPAGDEHAETEERELHFGLFILGTEKHESRRIDNQLRGRSGRQGDPGHSIFFVALDDEIMRKMGWEKIQSLARMMMSKEMLATSAFTQSQFTSSIERSQKQMEGRHFGIRKHLFEYDSVINKQRQAIYAKREWILRLEAWLLETERGQVDEAYVELDVLDEVRSFVWPVVEELVDLATAYDPWNIAELVETLQQITGATFLEDEYGALNTRGALINVLEKQLHEMLDIKTSSTERERVLEVCRRLYLSVIDYYWMQHIDEMQTLREKVSLYGYAQVDPLIIYKKEAFAKYQALLSNIKKETLGRVLRVEFVPTEQQADQHIPEILLDGSEGGHVVVDMLKWATQDLPAQQPQRSPKPSASRAPSTWSSDDDVEVIELDEAGGFPTDAVTVPAPSQKIRPNDKVAVKYTDGRVDYDIKWKKVKADVESGEAELLG